jgi:hypothetical protein
MAASLRERTAIHEAGHATAAITYGVPVVAVTIQDRPHLRGGQYRAPAPDLGFEAIAVLCLSGIAAEELFCGPTPTVAISPNLRMA